MDYGFGMWFWRWMGEDMKVRGAVAPVIDGVIKGDETNRTSSLE